MERPFLIDTPARRRCMRTAAAKQLEDFVVSDPGTEHHSPKCNRGAYLDACPGACPAGEGSFSVAFASRYVWRGQTLSKGFVAQPTVGITLGGFNAIL